MRTKEISEKYIRIVKDMYHQSQTVVKCESGTTEPFGVEVGLPTPVIGLQSIVTAHYNGLSD